MSKTLQRVPDFAVDCLFIHPHLRDEAESWLAENRQQILTAADSTEGSTDE